MLDNVPSRTGEQAVQSRPLPESGYHSILYPKFCRQRTPFAGQFLPGKAGKGTLAAVHIIEAATKFSGQ